MFELLLLNAAILIVLVLIQWAISVRIDDVSFIDAFWGAGMGILAVASWLLLSFRLTRLPGVAVTLSRYGRSLFPFVLMWLGLRILHDSGVVADLRPLG